MEEGSLEWVQITRKVVRVRPSGDRRGTGERAGVAGRVPGADRSTHSTWTSATGQSEVDESVAGAGVGTSHRSASARRSTRLSTIASVDDEVAEADAHNPPQDDSETAAAASPVLPSPPIHRVVFEETEATLVTAGAVINVAGLLYPSTTAPFTVRARHLPDEQVLSSMAIRRRPRLWTIDRQTFRSIVATRIERRRLRLVRWLGRVPLLSEMHAEERYRLASLMTELRYEAGSVVVTQGMAPRRPGCFWVILRGKAEVFSDDGTYGGGGPDDGDGGERSVARSASLDSGGDAGGAIGSLVGSPRDLHRSSASGRAARRLARPRGTRIEGWGSRSSDDGSAERCAGLSYHSSSSYTGSSPGSSTASSSAPSFGSLPSASGHIFGAANRDFPAETRKRDSDTTGKGTSAMQSSYRSRRSRQSQRSNKSSRSRRHHRSSRRGGGRSGHANRRSSRRHRPVDSLRQAFADLDRGLPEVSTSSDDTASSGAVRKAHNARAMAGVGGEAVGVLGT